MPDPDGDHGRRSVRIAVISLIVSSVLTVVGFVVTATTSGRTTSDGGTTVGSTTTGSTTTSGTDGGTAGGEKVDATTGGTDGQTSGEPDGGTDGETSGEPDGGTEETVTAGTDAGTDAGTEADTDTDTESDDGLTPAERDLRDSLNDSQWQRDSCRHSTVPDAEAALVCTVSAQDAAGFAYAAEVAVTAYPSKDVLRSAFRKYAANLPLGNCDVQQGVQGRWTDGTSSKPVGDTACFINNTGMYDIIRTFYDRPVAFEVVGNDPVGLTNWVNALDPVFVD
ncbi:hypothetical protein [Streptomyces sp. SP17KL33]|uniref:hypothetical protein n=1 Tax=Streptomyces sp. SP17KL33 TaxID=3002534 RepID=UPI002E7813B8|nr:hypothetical protein [Streptomyces sp. SP17KL33]MEE1835362.1 hypothetical protein [Streptomyces sp. SP17KL33]